MSAFTEADDPMDERETDDVPEWDSPMSWDDIADQYQRLADDARRIAESCA